MASTLTSILLHITFSTKERRPILTPEVEIDLYDYLGALCRNHGCALLTGNGTADHVHLLVSLSKTLALSSLMMELKRDSSKMLKHRLPHFGWQDGYFAFSIGRSGVEETRAYIAKQKDHHREVSFQDEVRAFCRKYELELNEQYAWD
jgi:putative transposase